MIFRSLGVLEQEEDLKIDGWSDCVLSDIKIAKLGIGWSSQGVWRRSIMEVKALVPIKKKKQITCV